MFLSHRCPEKAFKEWHDENIWTTNKDKWLENKKEQNYWNYCISPSMTSPALFLLPSFTVVFSRLCFFVTMAILPDARTGNPREGCGVRDLSLLDSLLSEGLRLRSVTAMPFLSSLLERRPSYHRLAAALRVSALNGSNYSDILLRYWAATGPAIRAQLGSGPVQVLSRAGFLWFASGLPAVWSAPADAAHSCSQLLPFFYSQRKLQGLRGTNNI